MSENKEVKFNSNNINETLFNSEEKKKKKNNTQRK
jgi:hypothetical protein